MYSCAVCVLSLDFSWLLGSVLIYIKHSILCARGACLALSPVSAFGVGLFHMAHEYGSGAGPRYVLFRFGCLDAACGVGLCLFVSGAVAHIGALRCCAERSKELFVVRGLCSGFRSGRRAPLVGFVLWKNVRHTAVR